MCGLGRAGKGHTGNTRVIDQLIADHTPRSRHQLEGRTRNTGLKDQFGGTRCNKRRLLGRFGDNRIPRGKGCSHLTQEDRKREVPWANANKHPTAFKWTTVAESFFGAVGIVTTEINGFSNFGNTVRIKLARFALTNGNELVHMIFEQITKTPQCYGPIRTRRCIPRVIALNGGNNSRLNVGLGRLDKVTDLFAKFGRVHYINWRSRNQLAINQWCCVPGFALHRGELFVQRQKLVGIG